MGYLEKNLSKDEKIIMKSRLTVLVFLRHVIWFLIIWMIFSNSMSNDPTMGGIFGFVCMVFIIFLVVDLNKFSATEIALTDKRLLFKEGVFSRNVIELKIDQIESISLKQSFGGMVFNYGTLIITGTGGTDEKIYWINAPLKFKNKIYEIKK